MTTTDSNLGAAPRATPTPYAAARRETEIDVVIVREGKNLKGRLLGGVLGDLRQARPGQGARESPSRPSKPATTAREPQNSLDDGSEDSHGGCRHGTSETRRRPGLRLQGHHERVGRLAAFSSLAASSAQRRSRRRRRPRRALRATRRSRTRGRQPRPPRRVRVRRAPAPPSEIGNRAAQVAAATSRPRPRVREIRSRSPTKANRYRAGPTHSANAGTGSSSLPHARVSPSSRTRRARSPPPSGGGGRSRRRARRRSVSAPRPFVEQLLRSGSGRNRSTPATTKVATTNRAVRRRHPPTPSRCPRAPRPIAISDSPIAMITISPWRSTKCAG